MLQRKDTLKTLTRLYAVTLGAVVAAGSGCRKAPAADANAMRWPDMIAYRVDYVAEVQRDREALGKFAESKTLRLNRRDSLYLGVFDSVLKTSQRPGQPLVQVPYAPVDTLIFSLSLDGHGKLGAIALGCDRALPECQAALPSLVLTEMRRIIPRLSGAAAPRGTRWMDTLAFDDASRPGGTRGTVVTAYTSGPDTTIGGRVYWMVGWRAMRRAFGGEGGEGPLGAMQPLEETGITLIDRQLMLPALSSWAGAVSAPTHLRQTGATGSGFRGRAYLAGSVFDSLYAREMLGP